MAVDNSLAITVADYGGTHDLQVAVQCSRQLQIAVSILAGPPTIQEILLCPLAFVVGRESRPLAMLSLLLTAVAASPLFVTSSDENMSFVPSVLKLRGFCWAYLTTIQRLASCLVALFVLLL